MATDYGARFLRIVGAHFHLVYEQATVAGLKRVSKSFALIRLQENAGRSEHDFRDHRFAVNALVLTPAFRIPQGSP